MTRLYAPEAPTDFHLWLHRVALEEHGGLPPGTFLDTVRTIVVDEAQDLCETQVALLRRLCRDLGGGIQVLLVGDPRQCIYSFRGADATYLLDAAPWADAAFAPMWPAVFTCAATRRLLPLLVDFVNTVPWVSEGLLSAARWEPPLTTHPAVAPAPGAVCVASNRADPRDVAAWVATTYAALRASAPLGEEGLGLIAGTTKLQQFMLWEVVRELQQHGGVPAPRELDEEGTVPGNTVAILTAHRTKGLSLGAAVVFLESMPTTWQPPAHGNGPNEACLLYVALTRARRYLLVVPVATETELSLQGSTRPRVFSETWCRQVGVPLLPRVAPMMPGKIPKPVWPPKPWSEHKRRDPTPDAELAMAALVARALRPGALPTTNLVFPAGYRQLHTAVRAGLVTALELALEATALPWTLPGEKEPHAQARLAAWASKPPPRPPLAPLLAFSAAYTGIPLTGPGGRVLDILEALPDASSWAPRDWLALAALTPQHRNGLLLAGPLLALDAPSLGVCEATFLVAWSALRNTLGTLQTVKGGRPAWRGRALSNFLICRAANVDVLFDPGSGDTLSREIRVAGALWCHRRQIPRVALWRWTEGLCMLEALPDAGLELAQNLLALTSRGG